MLEGHLLVMQMLMVEMLVVEVLPVDSAVRASRAAGAVAVAEHSGDAQLAQLVPEASTAGLFCRTGSQRSVQLIGTAYRSTQLVRVEATR